METWTKTNEIEFKVKESTSNKIVEGNVIKQSVQEEKIAKRDTLAVTVSLGKGYKIPGFANNTPEAATAVEGLTVQVKMQLRSWLLMVG